MILAAVCMLTGTATPSVLAQGEAGWRENEVGWWYQNPDGSYQKNGWFQDIDQNWYYFDTEGYMQTGWIRDKGFWYFAEESGKMQTGVIQINGQTYYFNPVLGSDLGKMQTGKVNIQNKVYYFNANGTAIGEIPHAERSYQVPLQSTYVQDDKYMVDSKVNHENKDRVVLFENHILEEMIRTYLKEQTTRNLTWNDLKGYSVVSIQMMTDSRSRLIFQIELREAETMIGMIQVGLEELESVVKDLSKFPDLKKVEIKGIYMKSSLTNVAQGDEENLTDMEVLLDVLAEYLSIEDMLMKIDFELSVKTE